MNDKRLTTRMVKVWDKLSELQPPPLFAQFNYNSVSDLWQQCAILTVNPASHIEDVTFTIMYLGDKAAELMVNKREGSRLTPQSFARSYKKMLAGITDCVEHRSVVINEGSTVNHESKVLKYRVCLLPFADNHQHVTHIIVGFSWMEC
jgi:hypothetical protein